MFCSFFFAHNCIFNCGLTVDYACTDGVLGAYLSCIAPVFGAYLLRTLKHGFGAIIAIVTGVKT